MSIDDPICQYCGSLMVKKQNGYRQYYYKCPVCGEDSDVEVENDDTEDEGE